MRHVLLHIAMFQSTLPARGATRAASGVEAIACFNPRSRRGERPRCRISYDLMSFQSTLPARGATFDVHRKRMLSWCFNPRSRRGERPALRAACRRLTMFQSTLPARGATRVSGSTTTSRHHVSIHAPGEGSDVWRHQPHSCDLRFNPRSRRGERPSVLPCNRVTLSRFNPRSRRGERPRSMMHLQCS